MGALQGWSPYFLYFILIAIFMAVLVGVGIIIITSLTIKKSAKKKLLIPQAPEVEKQRQLISQEHIPWTKKLTHWIRQLLIHWGMIPKDELSRVFIKAIRLLKTYIGGHNYRYQIPWFLLLGTEKSGKSTLMRSLDIELPIGRPDFDVIEQNPICDWWFFNRGIVMDIRGDQVLFNDAPRSDEKGWRYLLSLIARHRPKRPLDGVIITIPADELTGAGAISEGAIYERAKHLARKLWQSQAYLSMRVPIYVLVTKCDKLTGFDQLTQELPPERLNEILGWSNPYSLEVGYSTGWTEKVFEAVEENLRKLRALVFSQSLQQRDRSSAFLFPRAFHSMFPRLKNYLDQMFKDSAFHESFFLRGVYFVGDTARNSPAEFIAPPPIAEDPNPNALVTEDYAPSQPSVAFLKDLIAEKIFTESDLAQPVLRILHSTHRILNFSKAAVLGLSLLWSLGLFISYQNLRDTSRRVTPLLQHIKRSMDGIIQLDVHGKEQQLNQFLSTQSDTLLKLMSTVSDIKLFYLSLPASWFSPIDSHIRELLTISYDNVILRDLYSALFQKGEQLVDISKMLLQTTTDKGQITPLKLDSYKNMDSFVYAIADFEKNVKTYNTLEATQSVDAIAQLVLYLYGRELPPEFYDSTTYFKNALGAAKNKNIKLEFFKEKGQQKLLELDKRFINSAIDIRKNFAVMVELGHKLEQLSQPNTNRTDDEDLRTILADMKEVDAIMSDPSFKWIEGEDFFPGEPYNEMITKVGASDILGVAIAEQVTDLNNKKFTEFKDLLKKFSNPLSKTFLQEIKGQIIAQPSDTFVSLLTLFNTFAEKSFMEKLGAERNLMETPKDQLLFWDPVVIQSAEQLIKDYDKYVADELLQAPMELRDIFKSTAMNALRKKILNLVAKSQIFQDKPIGTLGFGSKEVLQSQIQNLREITSPMQKVLGIFQGSRFDMRSSNIKSLLINHAYALLDNLDKQVASENLYTMKSADFSWWKGDNNPALRAFGVGDAEGLAAYVEAQRQRIAYYSKSLADPVITFLNMAVLEASPANLPLMLKWSRISKQLDDYGNKTPGNALGNLEDFLTVQATGITTQNCGDIRIAKGGDFFTSRLNGIETKLKERCDTLAREEFIDKYNRLARYFNTQIGGRYPFKTGHYVPGTPEVSADVLKTFYKEYDRFTPYELVKLADEAKQNVEESEADQFLKQMSSIRALLVPDDTQADAPAPEVQVEFRTNRKAEFGANQIVEFGIKFGNKLIADRDPEKKAEFKPGQPIQVVFRWAANGQNVPVRDPLQPTLQVTGTQATFDFSGNWGIIELLSEHASESPAGSGSTKAWRLKFEIPTVAAAQGGGGQQPGVLGGRSTVVFIDLAITEKNPTKATFANLVDLKDKLPVSAKILTQPTTLLASAGVQ